MPVSEAMKPGRELDALVAERVMGWTREPKGWLSPPMGDPRMMWAATWDEAGRPGYLPSYSTDIAAVWEVVEQMGTKEILGVLTLGAPCDDNPKWRAIFTKKWVANLDAYPDGIEHGDSAPHAICLAALKATGHDPYDPEVLQQGHT